MKNWTVVLANNLYATWIVAAKSTRRAMARKRCLILLAICSLPVLSVALWRVFAPIGGSDYQGPSAYEMYVFAAATSFLPFLVPLVPLFLGTAAINDEIEEKTIMFLFLRPVSKFTIVLAKTISVMLTSVAILGGTMTLVFSICASSLSSKMIPGDLPMLLKDIGVFALASFAYGGLFVLMGVFLRRPYILGLFYVIAWDSYAAYLPGKAGLLNIKHYVTSIFPHQTQEQSPLRAALAVLCPHTPAEPMFAAFVLIGVGLVCAFLAYVAFQARDYGFEKPTA